MRTLRLPLRVHAALAGAVLGGAAILALCIPTDRLIGEMLEADQQLELAASYYIRWSERFPADYEARLHAAELLLATVRPAEAVGMLERLARDWPEDEIALTRLVEVEDSLLNVEGTIARLEALVVRRPADPVILGRLADHYRWFGESEKLVDTLTRLIALRDLPAERAELVEILLARRRYDELVAILSANLEASPNQAEARLALYETYLRSGRTDDAIAELGRVVALEPERIDRLRELARLLIEADRWDEVVALYDARLATRGGDGEALRADLRALYLEMAHTLVARGERARAMELYRARIAMERTDVALRLEFAGLHGRAADQVAIAELTEVVRLAPTSLEAWRALAERSSWTGRLDAAVDAYRRAVALAPSSVELRRSLAQHLVWTDRIPEAIDIYRALVTPGGGSPADREALIELLTDAGRGAEAVEHATTLRARHGLTPRRRRLLAQAWVAAADCRSALPELRSLVRDRSTDLELWHSRAVCATRLGFADEALEALREVQRLRKARSSGGGGRE